MGRKAKLTKDEQEAVRRTPGPLVHFSLAAKYSVSPYTIYRIRKRDDTAAAPDEDVRPPTCPVCKEVFWFETDMIGRMLDRCRCGARPSGSTVVPRLTRPSTTTQLDFWSGSTTGRAA